jgi:hypothetical protein
MMELVQHYGYVARATGDSLFARLALGSPSAEPNPPSTLTADDQNGQSMTHSMYEGHTLSESQRAAIDRSNAEALFPRLRGVLS